MVCLSNGILLSTKKNNERATCCGKTYKKLKACSKEREGDLKRVHPLLSQLYDIIDKVSRVGNERISGWKGSVEKRISVGAHCNRKRQEIPGRGGELI